MLLSLLPLASLCLSAPPTFSINISAPPRLRWKGAVGSVLAAHDFASGFGQIFEYHNRTLFSRLPAHAWDTLASSIDNYWPEQGQELRGIADDFAAHGHAEVSYPYLAGWVWFHALAHTDAWNQSATDASVARECTALLARGAAGGTMHVGNMDQSPPAVRNVTLRVRFVQSDGSLIFEGVDWYWITTGVSRAVRSGVASLQENWRESASPIPLARVLKAISAGPSVATPQMWVFREALLVEPPLPFGKLASRVASAPIAAPFYIIAGGPSGEGVVFARNETASVSTAHLGDDGRDYLVQTNYDRWLPDPADDPRRSRAEAMLESLHAAAGGVVAAPAAAARLSWVDLFAVASAYPVHNPHTAYTAVLDPAAGTCAAYVRDSLCPTDPSEATREDSRYCQPHETSL